MDNTENNKTPIGDLGKFGLIYHLAKKAKTENKKIEAEKLLRYLIQNWWNKDLSKFE